MKRLFGFCTLGLLTACSGYSLQQLKHTTPSGSEFNQILARHYLSFAESFAERYSWDKSSQFADKGLLVAYNHEVGPEAVSDYVTSPDAAVEFDRARAMLLEQLTDKNITSRPAIAADALFYFDCWIVQHVTRPDEAANCKENFDERILELADTSFEALLIEQGEMQAVDTTSYIVFFPWGQTIISEQGAAVIDKVAADLVKDDAYQVILNGHTDLSGDAQYNLRLSKRRAEAVKERLVQAGVAKDNIQIFAYGESDPAVVTPDGKAQPANRRVEIFLGE